jgi:hypothetical protein
MRAKYTWLIVLLVLVDFAYSFYQHFHTHFDGDMASFILRTDRWRQLYSDPFGFNVIFGNQSYPDPNRFFSHWAMSSYFRLMPFLLQRFMTPLNSIYFSCAIIKTLTQGLLIFLLSALISGRNIRTPQFWRVALFVTPLFQTFGYNGHMGIIDQSISYFFFYAFPFAFLFLFYSIIYFSKKKLATFKILILFVLCIVLPYSGPLISGIIIIANPLILFIIYTKGKLKTKTISPQPLKWISIILCLQFLLAGLSLYIGMHNSINEIDPTPLIERFRRLPLGIFYLLTQKLGLPLLVLIVIFGLVFIRNKYNSAEGKVILKVSTFLLTFSVCYIFLLPFGGYRSYRPNILRFDTFMPITFILITLFGMICYYLSNVLQPKPLKSFIVIFTLIAVVYSNSDRSTFKDYYCERTALENISNSPEQIVKINSDCTIMAWNKIADPDLSTEPACLLYYFRITKEKKLYFQE